jgi:amino acid transporter
MQAKTAIPYALVSVIGTMLVLAIWLFFTASCQEPGVGKMLYGRKTFFPYVFGYMKIFGLPYNEALWICIVPSIGSAIAYHYIISKQIFAMASSGLLPPILSMKFFGSHGKGKGVEDTDEDDPSGIPIFAFIFTAAITLGGNFFARYVNIFTSSNRTAITAGCFVYLSMFYCYYMFNRRYGHMERHFVNPLGIFAPILGSIIFLATLIILVGFHLEYLVITACFLCYIGVMLLFYYFYVETHQRFSASEQKVFFKAYIIKCELFF